MDRRRLLITGIISNSAKASPSSDPIGDALRSNAIAYWKLDETSGTRADSTGRGNSLTPIGSSTVAAGKVGNAIFPDTAQALSINSNADMTISSTSYTIALWLRRTDNTVSMSAIGKDDNVENYTDEYVIGIDQSTNRLWFWFSINNAADYPTVPANSFGNVPLNQWFFVVAWFDFPALSLNIQVDNGTIDTLVTSAAPDQNAYPVTVGSLGGSNHWRGGIDEVGFWKRKLTADERSYLYNSGNGRTLYE